MASEQVRCADRRSGPPRRRAVGRPRPDIVRPHPPVARVAKSTAAAGRNRSEWRRTAPAAHESLPERRTWPTSVAPKPSRRTASVSVWACTASDCSHRCADVSPLTAALTRHSREGHRWEGGAARGRISQRTGRSARRSSDQARCPDSADRDREAAVGERAQGVVLVVDAEVPIEPAARLAPRERLG